MKKELEVIPEPALLGAKSAIGENLSLAGKRVLPPGFAADMDYLSAALSTYQGSPAGADVAAAWENTLERIVDLWSDYLRRNKDAADRCWQVDWLVSQARDETLTLEERVGIIAHFPTEARKGDAALSSEAPADASERSDEDGPAQDEPKETGQ